MSKAPTPKQRIALILKKLKARNSREGPNARQGQSAAKADTSDHLTDKKIREVGRILRKPLRTLFDKAGADIKNDDEWRELLMFIAWAIYSKDPGREKEWTKKKLLRLLADDTKVKFNNTNLTEGARCEVLSRTMERYLDVTARTLRRRLQDAKKLASQQTVPANRPR
jgi:DNA-directed RNA polymerase beta subunit